MMTWTGRLHFSLVFILGLGAGLCSPGSDFNGGIFLGFVALGFLGLVLREAIFGINFLDQHDLSSQLGHSMVSESVANLAQPGSYEFYYAGAYIDRGIAQKHERREIYKAIEPRKRIIAQVASLLLVGAGFWVIIQCSGARPQFPLILTLPALGFLVPVVSLSQLLIPVFFIVLAVLCALPGEFDVPPWQLQVIFVSLLLHLRIYKQARIELQTEGTSVSDIHGRPFLEASARDIGLFLILLWIASALIPRTQPKMVLPSPSNKQVNGLIKSARSLNQWAGNKWSHPPDKSGSRSDGSENAQPDSQDTSSMRRAFKSNDDITSNHEASLGDHQPSLGSASSGASEASQSSGSSTSGPEGKNVSSQGVRPPLIADALLLKIIHYLKWLFFGAVGLAVALPLMRWLSAISPSQKNTRKLRKTLNHSLALQEFRAGVAELNSKKLSSREEVIRRYQLFLALMKGTALPRADYLPTTDYHEDLRCRYPGFSRPILNLNEIYCDVYYGKKEITSQELKVFREDFDTLTQLFV